MAEYIPLDHMRQLDKPMEEWTTASPRPCSRPTGRARSGLVGFAASIRRIGESPRAIRLLAILFCLIIWAVWAVAIWRLG